MHDGRETTMNMRSARPAASFAGRPKSGGDRLKPRYSQNARKNYQRYLALARAEALIGDMVGAENYYQHAEHYLRSMNSAS
jgi:Domain of unknown function (DUF4167)